MCTSGMPEFGVIYHKLNPIVRATEHYENGYDIDIAVDGGINDITSKKVIEKGANILVSGSYITNNKNYKDAIDSLKK